jgi:hypothetical protein
VDALVKAIKDNQERKVVAKAIEKVRAGSVRRRSRVTSIE